MNSVGARREIPLLGSRLAKLSGLVVNRRPSSAFVGLFIAALLSGCPPVTCEWLRVCAARTSPADPWPDAALYAPASLRVLPTDDDSLAAALPPTAPKAWVHHRSTALAGFAFTLDAACTAANPKLPAVLTSAGGKVVAEGATAPDRMRLVSSTPSQ
jgi:hypothetical protein